MEKFRQKIYNYFKILYDFGHVTILLILYKYTLNKYKLSVEKIFYILESYSDDGKPSAVGNLSGWYTYPDNPHTLVPEVRTQKIEYFSNDIPHLFKNLFIKYS